MGADVALLVRGAVGPGAIGGRLRVGHRRRDDRPGRNARRIRPTRIVSPQPRVLEPTSRAAPRGWPRAPARKASVEGCAISGRSRAAAAAGVIGPGTTCCECGAGSIVSPQPVGSSRFSRRAPGGLAESVSGKEGRGGGRDQRPFARGSRTTWWMRCRQHREFAAPGLEPILAPRTRGLGRQREWRAWRGAAISGRSCARRRRRGDRPGCDARRMRHRRHCPVVGPQHGDPISDAGEPAAACAQADSRAAPGAWLSVSGKGGRGGAAAISGRLRAGAPPPG